MDRTIRIWDTDSGACLCTIRGHRGGVLAAAFDPEGRVLATGGNDGTKLWDVDSGELRTTLDTGDCRSVAFSPHNRILATANGPSEVTLWELASGVVCCRLTGHAKFVASVVFDAESGMLATSSADGTIMLWEVAGGRVLRTLAGHSDDVNSIALHPAGEFLASASSDHTVRLWDLATGRTVSILEGHTGSVCSLSFSGDGRVLASKSGDGTVRLWDTQSGRCRAILPALRSRYWAPSVAFHPHLPILAVVGSGAIQSLTRDGSILQLWELDVDHLLVDTGTSSVSYTTAKIVLVGESGVGKTGLGWRLSHGEFIEHASTHGQQFWLLDELGGTGADGTERDVILWDLAEQPDYRLIHALYLDDVDLALVLFDPTGGDDPLRGVKYWLHQLGRDCPVILVAARSDRGAPRLTVEEIESFCTEHCIGGYVATSALRGDGLDELVERMRVAIRWDERPKAVTTQAFKRIKNCVLKLEEKLHVEKTILSLAELRVRLEQEYPDVQFTDDELLTAVRHLSNHGYVADLRTSRGESRILLAPVLLNNLAASMVLEARRNPNGLGALEEQRVLSDAYHFPELAGLSQGEGEVLLDSAVAMFLEHSICFRESDPLTKCSYLVFPELINLKKPVVGEQRVEEGTAYTVRGAVGNVYASLVVLLGYTSVFTRSNQWHNHARYVVGDGLVCGLRVETEREGELDFVLYFGAMVGPPIRMLFQSLFESFLNRPHLKILRYEVVHCSKGHQVNRAVVREQLADGKDSAFCPRCGQRVTLPPPDTPIVLTLQQVDDRDTLRKAADQRSRFEKMLFRLTTYVTQEGIPAPDCFISYAWGDERHERWVEHELAEDLTKAGVTVVLDRWENRRVGTSVPRFVERVAAADRVIVVGTPRYRTRYDNDEPMGNFVVAAEGDLIGNRLIGSEGDKNTVLPALLEGSPESSFPPLLHGRVYADFRSASQYFPTIFELILSIYQIPSHEPVWDLKRQLDDSTETA